jgi:hypothetical protein
VACRLKISPTFLACLTSTSRPKAQCAGQPMATILAGLASQTRSQARRLLLINYEHHPVDSPYRMRFAIFVREGDQTYDKVNEIPEQLRKRTLAVRSFDTNGMMVDNRLVDGQQIEPVIEKLLAPSNVDYLHIHFAAAGCYAARVDRA